MTDWFEQLLDEVNNLPNERNRLYRELEELPELKDCVRALSAFASSIAGAGKYFHQGDRYVLNPNFVAFTPRYKRKKHVVIELRGAIAEFESHKEVELQDARAGSYSKFVFSNPRQLCAAANHIQRAYMIYSRGRSRIKTVEETKELPIER